MQKITPFLWFDTQAEEAVNFYTEIFPDSEIGTIARYGAEGAEVSGQPEGAVMTVEFTLAGQEFSALNGGPVFQFTPGISFLVLCKTEEEVSNLWKELSENGTVLMELDEYPFSKRYGWCQDRYGLSWQVMYEEKDEIKQKIIPTLMFTQDVCGQAEAAMQDYMEIFPNSEIGAVLRYAAGEEPDQPGTIKHASFRLTDTAFAVMDSARVHDFGFTEAVSFMVSCEDQEEIDRFWNKLSAVPEAEQCGWLKDKYGVSWQIVPAELGGLMENPQTGRRVMAALLKMKKIDIEKLREAADSD